jgi:hypothetical protein
MYHSRFVFVAITTGNTFRQSATSVDRTLACRTCASSPRTYWPMTFHRPPSRPLNPPARRGRGRAPPLPQSSPLFPSRRQKRFHVRGGARGCYDSRPLRRPQSLRLLRRHQHRLISLSQVLDQPHLQHYHHYRPIYTRASASTTALRSARSTNRRVRRRCRR